jgi:hypothetical protein
MPPEAFTSSTPALAGLRDTAEAGIGSAQGKRGAEREIPARLAAATTGRTGSASGADCENRRQSQCAGEQISWPGMSGPE